ncbi:MAG: polysaccharide biosynthesis protein GtrA [Paenibacillus sp.]|nr:polysaccharide biosynthesis protein GtrA [Paenibacillus sp.]
MKKLVHSLWNHSFVRFLLVGVLNTIVGLSIAYLLLNAIGTNYWVSTFFGNCIGAVVSYFLNKAFTFQSQVSIGSSIWKFASVILVCYVVSYAAARGISNGLLGLADIQSKGWADNLAVLLGAGFYTISNYLGQRFFVFRSSSKLQRKAGEAS